MYYDKKYSDVWMMNWDWMNCSKTANQLYSKYYSAEPIAEATFFKVPPIQIYIDRFCIERPNNYKKNLFPLNDKNFSRPNQ